MVGFENLVKSMIVSILPIEIKSCAIFLLPKYVQSLCTLIMFYKQHCKWGTSLSFFEIP